MLESTLRPRGEIRSGRDVIFTLSHSRNGANVIANGSAGHRTHFYNTARVGTVILLGAEATRECGQHERALSRVASEA
jgi:hypothetical protein